MTIDAVVLCTPPGFVHHSHSLVQQPAPSSEIISVREFLRIIAKYIIAYKKRRTNRADDARLPCAERTKGLYSLRVLWRASGKDGSSYFGELGREDLRKLSLHRALLFSLVYDIRNEGQSKRWSSDCADLLPSALSHLDGGDGTPLDELNTFSDQNKRCYIHINSIARSMDHWLRWMRRVRIGNDRRLPVNTGESRKVKSQFKSRTNKSDGIKIIIKKSYDTWTRCNNQERNM